MRRRRAGRASTPREREWPSERSQFVGSCSDPATDGDEALPDWERWMAEEDAYVERERPAEHADLVLPGDADLALTRTRR